MRRIAKTRQSLILCVISLKNITVILYILSFKTRAQYTVEKTIGGLVIWDAFALIMTSQ